VCFVVECILVDDGLRSGGQGNSPVFFAHHGCSGKAGAGGRDDTVQEQFHCGEVSYGGANFVGIVHKVAAYRESDALCFGFVGTFHGDEASICCFTSMRELGHVWSDAFGEASKFVGGALQPFVIVGSSNKLCLFV
jgi:hypothetical protein